MKKGFYVLASTVLATSLLATGCASSNSTSTPAAPTTQSQPAKDDKKEIKTADVVKVYKDITEEINKGKDGGKVDWDKVNKVYSDVQKGIVQALDKENTETVGEQIEATLQAGKDGKLSAPVVANLYEKLTQKVAFLQFRHDVKEANDNFKDKAKAANEVKEAKEYYEGILKPSVAKRDTAYEMQLAAAIDTGFQQMNEGIEKGDNLAFNLGKQIADKTIMKNAYLASGGEKGYGAKIEKAVKENTKDDTKVMQAEGWAFFQTTKAYITGQAQEEADLLEKTFSLGIDPKNIKYDVVSAAYVRGYAKVAKDEYKQMNENLGKDKGVITALEGALFIDFIKGDLPKALGSKEAANQLVKNTQDIYDAAKAGQKEKVGELYKKVEVDLDKLQSFGK